MRTSVKTLLYACVLSMTVSCSGSSASSSDVDSEIIDSIPIQMIDTRRNVLEVKDLGTFPAGKETREAVGIWNFDSIRGVRITSIDGDNLVSKCLHRLIPSNPTCLFPLISNSRFLKRKVHSTPQCEYTTKCQEPYINQALWECGKGRVVSA